MSAAGQAGGPVVVKLGGRPQGDPALPAALAALWRATGGALVLVHGGGDQISALQQLRGETPTFVGGRRVTTEGVLELVNAVVAAADGPPPRELAPPAPPPIFIGDTPP